MPDFYPNLPGVVVDLVEQKKAAPVAPTRGLTQGLLILGTASDGPLHTPIGFGGPDEAEAVFGKAELDGPGRPNLTRAAYEAYLAGARDIRLMKITGAYATAVIECAEKTETGPAAVAELLGVMPGNEATTIQCAVESVNDVLKTVSVTAGGSLLTTDAYEYTSIGADSEFTVTIKPGQASRGVAARVTYVYAPVESTVVTHGSMERQSPSVYYSGNRRWVDDVGTTVYVDGEEADAGTYVVDRATGIVTFTQGNEIADPSTVVTASYSYYKELAERTQTQDAVTLGLNVPFDLSQEPIAGSLILYVGGNKIIADGYVLEPSLKSITVKVGAQYACVGAEVRVEYNYMKAATYTPAIGLRSVGAAAFYNETTWAVQDIVGGKKLIITKPARKRLYAAEKALEYSTTDYPSLAALVNAINSDPRNNIVRADTLYPSELSVGLVLANTANLTGGDDGLNYTKAQLYEALGGVRDADGTITKEGAYTLLENYAVDYVALPGVYMDSAADASGIGVYDFAAQLAQFCAVSSMLNNSILGFIGVRPIANPTLNEVSSRVQTLVNTPHKYYMRNVKGDLMRDEDGDLIPISKYISVCAYPDFLIDHPRLGQYAADPAVFYAALAASMPGDAGTTHAALPGVRLRYELSSPMRDKLVGAQYVVFETGVSGPMVTVGCTAADMGSDYDSLMTMKIANTVSQAVRIISEPYIGKAYSNPVKAAHTQAIQEALMQFVKRGSLADFQFNIVMDRSGRNVRRAIVNLALTTAPELRKIHLFVTLMPSVG